MKKKNITCPIELNYLIHLKLMNKRKNRKNKTESTNTRYTTVQLTYKVENSSGLGRKLWVLDAATVDVLKY